MIKKDLFALQAGLAAVGKLQGVNFAYDVAKNSQIIKHELMALQEAVKPSDKFIEFDQKRIELCREHAEKDEKGGSIIVGSEFSIKDKQAFDADLANLRDEFRDVQDARENQIKEYEQLLEEPCDLNFHKVSKDDLPENITAEQMLGIIEIVEDKELERTLKAVK